MRSTEVEQEIIHKVSIGSRPTLLWPWMILNCSRKRKRKKKKKKKNQKVRKNNNTNKNKENQKKNMIKKNMKKTTAILPIFSVPVGYYGSIYFYELTS